MLKIAVFLVAACLSQAFADNEENEAKGWLPDPVVINVNFDYCACINNVGAAIKQYETVHQQYFIEGNITHFDLINHMKPKVQEMKEGACDYAYWKNTDAYQMSYDTLTASGLVALRRVYDPWWHGSGFSTESICNHIATQGPKMVERIKINLPILRTVDFQEAFDEGFYKNWKECNDRAQKEE